MYVLMTSRGSQHTWLISKIIKKIKNDYVAIGVHLKYFDVNGTV